jgi:metal-responsive CopG/Arc/MetJ family transcriptional regulator
MSKISKIAISLPENVLAAVEKERAESGESRSEIFRRAIQILLQQRRERELAEQYVSAYQRMPETVEEVTAARRSAGMILAEEPW